MAKEESYELRYRLFGSQSAFFLTFNWVDPDSVFRMLIRNHKTPPPPPHQLSGGSLKHFGHMITSFPYLCGYDVPLLEVSAHAQFILG